MCVRALRLKHRFYEHLDYEEDNNTIAQHQHSGFSMKSEGNLGILGVLEGNTMALRHSLGFFIFTSCLILLLNIEL